MKTRSLLRVLTRQIFQSLPRYRAHAGRRGRIVLLSFLPALLIGAESRAAESGSVTGTVKSIEGEGLPFANVVLLGTNLGAMTGVDGKFTIKRIPAGDYQLRVSFLGYEPLERAVQVRAESPVALEFRMEETTVATLQTQVVTAAREQIRRDDSGTRYGMTADDLSKLPVLSMEKAIATNPGVVMVAGQLHVRGGRGNETKYQVDGMPATDPLNGGGVSMANISAENIEFIVGGMDAEHGDAQGAIINILTKEGSQTFGGEFTYQTDDFGAPDRTFTNFDRVSLGVGGPTPVKDLTYYVSAQGTWTDTYLRTGEERQRSSILDFIRIGPRQDNHLQLQSKLAWKPENNYWATFEINNTSRSFDRYIHTFSRSGYVETRNDTIPDTGEIVTRYGDFSPEKEGPEWVAYEAPAHTPNYEQKFQQVKAVWNHTLAEETFYTMKLSRSTFDFTESVQGRLPWEYDGDVREFWADRIHFDQEPFFATNGDFPVYTRRSTDLWAFKSDWTHLTGAHKFKSGFEVKYNDLQNLSLEHPTLLNGLGTPGLTRNEYRAFNPEGSVYLQDRWEHEGMVLNAGVRYDVFSLGNQLDASVVESRTRSEWSPRVGFAYPVTDRDVFSFHYGRFSQIPDRQHIFQARGSSVRTRGNPNLDTQTQASYQAAVQHMFSEDVFGQFSVYFKDIFGLISQEEITSADSPDLVRQWTNRDYASSRGFEVSLRKRFSKNFNTSVSYTYSVATGVASDPDVSRQVDFLYLPISEQPLDWDQRHTLSVTGSIAMMKDWSTTFVWTYGSGRPYTPHNRDDRELDPLDVNSGRLPSSTNLTVEAARHFRMWGQAVTLFLQADNVLDTRNIVVLNPGNWPNPPGAQGDDYETYYTETGRAGGAYKGKDVNEDGEADWVALNDPRVFGPGRSVRMGVTVKF